MNTYELMIKTNDYLIKGGSLNDKQKNNIVKQLLSARSKDELLTRFYHGVNYPNNIDNQGRRLYPCFYIPPYHDGKKYKTIMTQTPKTQILSANSYELEIIRLLHLLSPTTDPIPSMVSETLKRLKTTCFGNRDDGLGECFDTSLIVLRFIATVTPSDSKWMLERIRNYHKYYDTKHRHWGVQWYYWLCLSELPIEIARDELYRYKEDLLQQIYRSYAMKSELDKATHPMRICVVRNCLARLPEYSYIIDRMPYLNEKDGRLHFDMEPVKNEL